MFVFFLNPVAIPEELLFPLETFNVLAIKIFLLAV